MLVILIIVLWVVIAVLFAGWLMHDDPSMWRDDDFRLTISVSLIGWPVMLPTCIISGVGSFICSKIGKLSLFVAGFLDTVFSKGEDNERVL